MPSHSVSCADCAETFQSARSNAKYCSACRLYRDLIFVKDNTAECWACGGRFCPTKRGMAICSTCAAHEYTKRGHCAFCEQDDQPMLTKGLAVCAPCALDVKNRRKLIRSVASRRSAQMEANKEPARVH